MKTISKILFGLLCLTFYNCEDILEEDISDDIVFTNPTGKITPTNLPIPASADKAAPHGFELPQVPCMPRSGWHFPPWRKLPPPRGVWRLSPRPRAVWLPYRRALSARESPVFAPSAEQVPPWSR